MSALVAGMRRLRGNPDAGSGSDGLGPDDAEAPEVRVRRVRERAWRPAQSRVTGNPEPQLGRLSVRQTRAIVDHLETMAPAESTARAAPATVRGDHRHRRMGR